MATEHEIQTYMHAAVEDHVDPKTGEVNTTTLAKDACRTLNGYDGDDIPEIYFDMAFVVSIVHEAITKQA